MGYLSGYSDPEYIESLQRISLPFLTNGKYRAFPAQGDSMPPFKDGSFIIGKYVEDIEDLKINKSYIFVTLNDGISYKRFKGQKKKAIEVSADNSFYKPYEIPLGEIVEIWQYASGIFPEDFEPDNFDNYNLKDMFLDCPVNSFFSFTNPAFSSSDIPSSTLPVRQFGPTILKLDKLEIGTPSKAITPDVIVNFVL